MKPLPRPSAPKSGENAWLPTPPQATGGNKKDEKAAASVGGPARKRQILKKRQDHQGKDRVWPVVRQVALMLFGDEW